MPIKRNKTRKKRHNKKYRKSKGGAPIFLKSVRDEKIIEQWMTLLNETNSPKNIEPAVVQAEYNHWLEEWQKINPENGNDNEYGNKIVSWINIDVHRTPAYPLRENVPNAAREEFEAAITHLIQAFCTKNLELGYAQGMADVMSFLLSLAPEADAFWIFDQIVNNPKTNWKNMYKNIGGSVLVVFNELLKLIMPNFIENLNKFGIENYYIINSGPLICLFSRGMDEPLLSETISRILSRGIVEVYRTYFAFLLVKKKEIYDMIQEKIEIAEHTKLSAKTNYQSSLGYQPNLAWENDAIAEIYEILLKEEAWRTKDFREKFYNALHSKELKEQNFDVYFYEIADKEGLEVFKHYNTDVGIEITEKPLTDLWKRGSIPKRTPGGGKRKTKRRRKKRKSKRRKGRRKTRKKRGKGGVFSCTNCGKKKREQETEEYYPSENESYSSSSDYDIEYLPLSPSQEKEFTIQQHKKLMRELKHEAQQKENFRKGFKMLVKENDDEDTRKRPISPPLGYKEMTDARISPSFGQFVSISDTTGGRKKTRRKRKRKRKYKSKRLKK